MSANSLAPGAQQERFAAYLNGLAQAAGHQDRATPLKSYCTGLLLPGQRKSVEPMADACVLKMCDKPISLCITWWRKLPGAMKTFWKRYATMPCPPCRKKRRLKPGWWMTQGFRKKGHIRSELRDSIVGKWANKRTAVWG